MEEKQNISAYSSHLENSSTSSDKCDSFSSSLPIEEKNVLSFSDMKKKNANDTLSSNVSFNLKNEMKTKQVIKVKSGKKNINVFRLLNLYKSIEDKLYDFVIECSESYEMDLFVCFGSIVGKYSKQKVKLPVLTDAMLEDSSDYIFIESVVMDKIYTFMNEIISRQLQTFCIQRQDDEVFIEDTMGKNEKNLEEQTVKYWLSSTPVHNDESDITGKNNLNILVYEEVMLGNICMYKPQSDLHYKVCGSSEACIRNEEKIKIIMHEKLLKRVWKSVFTWLFSPKKEIGGGPCFIVKIFDEYEIKEHDELLKSSFEEDLDASNNSISNDKFYNSFYINKIRNLLFTFKSGNSANGTKKGKNENEEYDEEEKRRSYMRIYIDKNQLKKQIQNYNNKKPNGIKLMIQRLLNNARCFLDYLMEESIFSELSGVPVQLYFPSYFGDVVATACKHYNKKKTLFITDSSIEALRKYNNLVKRCLIEWFVSPNVNVLDLACGHGQDLHKYKDINVRKYVGIDISKEEIMEARRRCTSYRMNCFAEFHVGNLLRKSTYAFLKKETFDVVSIQLAIHYLSASEEQINDFFSYVTENLNLGGHFIGSTVDCEVLADRAKYCVVRSEKIQNEDNEDIDELEDDEENENSKLYEYKFGNNIYSVTFNYKNMKAIRGGKDDNATHLKQPLDMSENIDIYRRRLNTTWGISYKFWLTESIDQKEYTLPWLNFCTVALKYGLRLELSLTFDEFLNECKNKQIPSLITWLQRNESKLNFDNEQKEVFSFYKVFVFTKIHESLIKNGGGGKTGGIDVGRAGAFANETNYAKVRAGTEREVTHCNNKNLFNKSRKRRFAEAEQQRTLKQKPHHSGSERGRGKFTVDFRNRNIVPHIEVVDDVFLHENELNDVFTNEEEEENDSCAHRQLSELELRAESVEESILSQNQTLEEKENDSVGNNYEQETLKNNNIISDSCNLEENMIYNDLDHDYARRYRKAEANNNSCDNATLINNNEINNAEGEEEEDEDDGGMSTNSLSNTDTSVSSVSNSNESNCSSSVT